MLKCGIKMVKVKTMSSTSSLYCMGYMRRKLKKKSHKKAKIGMYSGENTVDRILAI